MVAAAAVRARDVVRRPLDAELAQSAGVRDLALVGAVAHVVSLDVHLDALELGHERALALLVQELVGHREEDAESSFAMWSRRSET